LIFKRKKKKNHKPSETSYNLDDGEDLKKALTVKKISVSLFIMFIIAPHIIIYGINYKPIVDIIRKTSVTSITRTDLSAKLNNHEIEKVLVIVERKSDNTSNFIMKYLRMYFDRLKEGGLIYIYDDSWEFEQTKDDIEYMDIENSLFYDDVPVIFVVENNRVSNQYNSGLSSINLEELDKIQQNSLLRAEILNMYRYLDAVYNNNIYQELMRLVDNEIFRMNLIKIEKESAK
jgi:hypothetical protein